MKGLHHVRITIPEGIGVFTRIEVDDVEMRGVIFAGVEINAEKMAVLTLRLYADIEIEGEPEIVKTWRNAIPPRPSFLRRLIQRLWRTR